MFELNEQQKKEDFNRRLNLFQEALKGLSDNYQIMIEPTLHITSRGLIPVLSINDTKYAPVSSKESSLIIPKEQPTKDQKSLENDKKPLDGNTETSKK